MFNIDTYTNIMTLMNLFLVCWKYISIVLFSSRGLSVNDYVELIWTTFAEFPGTLLAFCLIDWIGRKKTLALLSFLFSISILGVIECATSKTILIILLFCSRGFATGLLQVNLFQKHLFLHQLTHNMTKDCSLNYQFRTWKLQAQNMWRTCCVQKLFRM